MANLAALKDYIIQGIGNMAVKIRLTDNGDGTFSEGVAGSGGGGGGAVTLAAGAVASGAYVAGALADGADVTQGSKADAAATSDTGSFSEISLSKRLLTKTPALGTAATAGSMPVNIASDDAQFGVEYTGYTQDTGGSGLRGTLSTIAKACRAFLTSILSVTIADVTVAATNITALNANPTTGAATANSTVSVALSGQSLVAVTITANTLGANATFQLTSDGLNWVPALWYQTPSTAALSTSGVVATGVLGQFLFNVAGAKGFRVSANTATVSGTLTAALNASFASTPFMVNQNLSALNGVSGVAALSSTGGTTAPASVVGTAAPTANADFSTAALAAATGTTSIITDVGGAAISADFNLSAYTPGSATGGLDLVIQYTSDNGTTWWDRWHCERMTATGHVFVPPILMPGRRRTRWQNNNGSNAATAATLATVSSTVNRLSIAPAVTICQFFDRTAAVLAGTPALSTTATYEISGCRNLVALVTLLAIVTTGASYQWSVSADGVNFGLVGSPVTATVGTTSIVATGVAGRFARLVVVTAETGGSQTGSVIAIMGS